MGIQFDGINNEIKSQTKIDFPGSVGVAGTLTYEDVANVDSIGIITARTGINIGPTAGVAGTFFADGSYVTAGIITAGSYRGDGSQLSGIAVGGASSITFNDNVGLYFGAGNNNGPDLEIIHEPSALVTSFKVHLNDAQFSKRSGNKVARFSTTGVSYLYYDDSIRLETTSSGMSLSGDISIADKIVHTGDTHTAIRFAGNDIITAEIAGSETLRIDGTGLRIVDKLLHSGDPDTMIRFPAADTFSVETGGSERLRITSAGHMGLGVNNPTKRLTVQAGSNNADIALFTGNDLNRGLLISTAAANSQNDMGVVYHAQGQHGGSYLGEHIFKTNNSERLKIDINGYVTKPAHPSFCARHQGSDGFSGDIIVLTRISTSWDVWNTGNHYSTSTGKFTVPVDGIYYFEGQVMSTGHSNNDNIQDMLSLESNRGRLAYCRQRESYFSSATNANGYYTNSVGSSARLNAGDTVWIQRHASQNWSYSNRYYSYFTGWLIG